MRNNLSCHFLANEIAQIWQWFGSDFPAFSPLHARSGNMWKFVQRTKLRESAADDQQPSEPSVSKETTLTTAKVSTCAPDPANISTAESRKKQLKFIFMNLEKNVKKMPLYRWHLPLEIFFNEQIWHWFKKLISSPAHPSQVLYFLESKEWPPALFRCANQCGWVMSLIWNPANRVLDLSIVLLCSLWCIVSWKKLLLYLTHW